MLLLTFILTGCRSKHSAEEPGETVLNLPVSGKLTGLDPGMMRDFDTIEVCSHIFESLYQYHFLKRPYEIIPLLAEDLPQISEDMKTYTIKIKRGVHFQDDKCFPGGKGRELKSQDFIYSIKRITDIKNLSQNWSLFDNRIVGLDEFREYTKSCKSKVDVDYSREVEGMQAPDDYTLVFKLKRPWPQFICTALADISTVPMAKEAVDFYDKDIISHPVGTGPFKLGVWQRGSYVSVVRNPTFRGELYPSEGEAGDAEAGYLDDAGKPIPFVDKIVWTIIEESQPAWLLFLQGKFDAMALQKDNFDEAVIGKGELTDKMKHLEIQLDPFEEPSTFWLGFNMQDPVLGKNKPLRRAISYAIDREKFIELFYGGLGHVAHGFVPPQMDSYDPTLNEKGYARYDPEQARLLLTEAEKIHGGKIPELKIAMPGTSTFYRQYGQFLERQLEAVGLDVEIQYMDWPSYIEKVNTRSAQMFTAGAVASIPDAEDFLGSFYTKNWSPGSNHFNYSNPDFDRLYDKVSVMSESSERTELYRKMELIVLEDCPAAFMCHRVIYRLYHNWYKNLKQNAFLHGMGKYRRIDPKKRAAYEELLKTTK
jgi:ABC-type transport system substrate-binding protein